MFDAIKIMIVILIIIKAIGNYSEYRYLGVLECDNIKIVAVKQLVQAEYKHKVVKIRAIRAVTTCAIAAVR